LLSEALEGDQKSQYPFSCSCGSVIEILDEIQDHFFDCPQMKLDYQSLFSAITQYIKGNKTLTTMKNLATILDLFQNELQKNIITKEREEKNGRMKPQCNPSL
jgi:hypothetical protein